jgi:hypothetical protein
MSDDISVPECGKCRWQVKLREPARHIGDDGAALGIAVYRGPWPGLDIGDQHYNALGAHYCEHPKQPRGLVLTNYSCINFERAPEIDNLAAIPKPEARI